jgi:hypothetical protein
MSHTSRPHGVAITSVPHVMIVTSNPQDLVGFAKMPSYRNATETPLERGLALERNLFLKLRISEPALARMRSDEQMNITSPSRSIEVETRSASRD